MATPTWLLAPLYTLPLSTSHCTPTPFRVLRPCRAACGCCCFVGQFGGTWCLAPCWAVNRAWPPVSHMACSHPSTHLPLAPYLAAFVSLLLLLSMQMRREHSDAVTRERSLLCAALDFEWEKHAAKEAIQKIYNNSRQSPLFLSFLFLPPPYLFLLSCQSCAKESKLEATLMCVCKRGKPVKI